MLTVNHLRCEYLEKPLGVDTDRPRFSWRLANPDNVRNCTQSAYQVQVWRVAGEAKVELWDSGQVTSSQSVNVEYGGEALASTWDCRWRVRVWDQAGNETPWSNDARFVMGMLSPGDFCGQWICCEQAEDYQHIWYRKTVELERVATTFAYVCSIGYHELYVNGKRIGDAVLTPGVTNLAKRGLYMTYDITEQLQPGTNVIAMWTGPGWARADGSYGKGVWDQSPMVRGHVVANGQTIVSTDTSWTCAISCSENIGLWNGGGRGTYGGELIDARRDQPHWNALEFDDTSWHDAATASQSIELSSAMFEPDRRVETVLPVSITPDGDEYIVDFGKNFTGWFEIDLRGGKAGDVVKIHTANREGERQEYDQESYYIFGDNPEGRFSHRFNWMAGRWVTLEGLRHMPKAQDIRGYIVTNSRRRTGYFESSNTLFNDIYETDLRTYIANTVNAVVMDCPHRERYGYGEVALACTWGCGIPNYESGGFYTKVARDWCDVQDDDGMVNTIAPQPYKGAGGTLWSSAPVTTAWEFYRAFGDLRQLRNSYPTIKRWLEYLAKAVTDDGVLMPYTIESRFLGDWATPHGNEYGNTTEAQIFNNGVYAFNLMAAIEMAKALGKADDVTIFTDRLASLRECAHRFFYDDKAQRYGDGLQQSQLFPLYTRITPEPLRETVFKAFLDALSEKGYLDTGSSGMPIMLKFVVEDLGRPELLLDALRRTTYPSYGNFISRGETTWPEYWEIDGIKSRIHTCYTSIAGYFVKGIGGIQSHPDSPGMQRVLIRPNIIGDLTHASTATETMYGQVVCDWERHRNKVQMLVQVPANSTATLRLHDVSADKITEGGQAVRGVEGISIASPIDGGATLELASGRYKFAYAMSPSA